MSDRVRYLGFAACLGAGIALLVYRFAVMGLVWDAPAKNVLQIASPVLIVVGAQLLRPIAKKRYPVLLMLVAAAAGFGVAFGICFGAIKSLDDAPLTTRALPGFSIGLPSGTTARENLGYSEGAVQLDAVAGTGNVVRIGWEPGRLFDDSEVEMIAKGIGSMGHTPIEHGKGPQGEPTVSLTIDTEKGPIRTIVTTCGGRRIMIMVSESASLARRIADTVACHPDPAKESSVDRMPWMTTLPDGWFAAPAQKGQLALTDGDSVLLARAIEKLPERAELPTLLQKLMAAAGVDMTIGAWTGDRFPVHATIEGKAYVGWAMPVDCKTSAVLLLGFGRDEAAADAIAAFAAKGHCLADGETTPVWPARH